MWVGPEVRGPPDRTGKGSVTDVFYPDTEKFPRPEVKIVEGANSSTDPQTVTDFRK